MSCGEVCIKLSHDKTSIYLEVEEASQEHVGFVDISFGLFSLVQIVILDPLEIIIA